MYKDACCRFKEKIKIYFKIGRSTKSSFLYLFNLILHACYICICFQFVAFVKVHMCYIYVCFQLVIFTREYMWHKALLMGYSMRLELTLVCSLNDFQLARVGFI